MKELTDKQRQFFIALEETYYNKNRATRLGIQSTLIFFSTLLPVFLINEFELQASDLPKWLVAIIDYFPYLALLTVLIWFIIFCVHSYNYYILRQKINATRTTYSSFSRNGE